MDWHIMELSVRQCLLKNSKIKKIDISHNRINWEGAIVSHTTYIHTSPILASQLLKIVLRFLMFNQCYKTPTIFNGENIRTLPDRFLEIINATNKAPPTARKKYLIIIQVLAHGLEMNDTLETLVVGHNPLTTTGCMDLIDAISSSCRLKTLDLSVRT